MHRLLKKHATKLKFAIVGGTNTIIDFGVLLLLVNTINMSYVAANIISISVAFVFSFIANRKFTFKSSEGNVMRQIVLFTVITLFGLWVIQSIIIALITPLFVGLGLDNNLSLLVAKLIATVASLLWNFILYSKVVFKSSSER